jgi:uncharacterized protein (DUF1015 family)
MATVLPFRGIRYNPKQVKDLAKVMAPPYDILSPGDQDRYYGLHSNNIVKLDFGKALAGDKPGRDKYVRSANMLRLWRESGVLLQDLLPSLYVIGQDFTTPEGKKKAFLGVIGELKLEPYKTGVVKPHERTLAGPKVDRLELTRATKANLSQVFMLFDDPKGQGQKWLQAQAKAKPSADIKLADGVRHRLWVVSKPAALKAFTTFMAKRPVYIADGHHRYETMLAYAAEAKGVKGAKGTMVAFAPVQSPGMVVLPTHRMLYGLRNFSAEALVAKLQKVFVLQEQKDLAGLVKALAKLEHGKQPQIGFGLLLPGGRALLLAFKKGLKPESLIKEKRSPAYKKLDVALLQSIILEGMLGMTAESIAAKANLDYTKSAQEAAEGVAHGTHQAAFILNPTRIAQVRDVADAKDVMPQKSTYFLPKLLTGLVLRGMD